MKVNKLSECRGFEWISDLVSQTVSFQPLMFCNMPIVGNAI